MTETINDVMLRLDTQEGMLAEILHQTNATLDRQIKNNSEIINKNALAVGQALEAQCFVMKEMHEKLASIDNQISTLRNEITILKTQTAAIMSSSFNTGPTA